MKIFLKQLIILSGLVISLMPWELTLQKDMGLIAHGSRYGDSIEKTLDESIPINRTTEGQGAAGARDTIVKIVLSILRPIIIIGGVFIAMLGFYKLFFSTGAEEISKGTQYITYGVIGILVMMMAPYIANTIYEDVLNKGDIGQTTTQIAGRVYDTLIFPILKIAMFVIVGILFFVLLIKGFTYLTSKEGIEIEKAKNIIIADVIGILVILGAENIISSIYGVRSSIENANAVRGTSVGDIGEDLLATGSIDYLYEIINWIMGFIGFIVLVLVILQIYKLLFNPQNEETLKDIKRNFLYIFIGIGIIGLGYVITNFLIPNL